MTFAEALQEHLSALQARDIARFAATLGDDATTVDGSGTIVRGTANVRDNHAAWFAAPERWRFDSTTILTRETPTAALALLRVEYRESEAAQPSRFLLSLVFERTSTGEWRFAYDQNTPLRT